MYNCSLHFLPFCNLKLDLGHGVESTTEPRKAEKARIYFTPKTEKNVKVYINIQITLE